MRQAQDPEFQGLLGQARAGILGENDLTLLNNRVVANLFMSELENATIIVKQNLLCYLLNWTQLEYFTWNQSYRIIWHIRPPFNIIPPQMNVCKLNNYVEYSTPQIILRSLKQTDLLLFNSSVSSPK